MILYRYENDKGVGPYNAPYFRMSNQLKDAHEGKEYPSIIEDYSQHLWDGVLPMTAVMLCVSACTSVDALKRWFDGWHELLHEQGFKPLVFDVKDSNLFIGQSGKQVLFKRFDGVITGQVTRELLY